MPSAGNPGCSPAAAPVPVTAVVDGESLARLIGLLGRSRFPEAFSLHCTARTGADQITAFLVAEGRVMPVLAYRARDNGLAERLAQRYASDFSARDAVLADWIEAGTDFAARSVTRADITDAAYRAHLFHDAGLQEKFCILSRHDERLLYLNFYFGEGPAARARAKSAAGIASEGRILLALLARHLALAGAATSGGTDKAHVARLLRARFPELSARDCEVAARIVCGYEASAIALELGLSVGTIATFRKRAYAKLGVCGQRELFSLALLPQGN